MTFGWLRPNYHRLKSVPLDKHHRLRAWNIKPFAARAAGEHVVDAHHIVARVLELAFIVFAGAAWESGFLGTLQPTHFVIIAGATVRATETGGLRFLLLVKKIAFIHKLINFPPFPAAPTIFQYWH